MDEAERAEEILAPAVVCVGLGMSHGEAYDPLNDFGREVEEVHQEGRGGGRGRELETRAVVLRAVCVLLP